MQKIIFHASIPHYLFVISLGIAPLYFGGERLLSWVIAGIWQAIILLSTVIKQESRSEFNKKQLVAHYFSIILSIAVIAWSILQTLSFQNNPLANQIWQLSNPELAHPQFSSISVSPDESILTTFKFIVVLFTYMNAASIYGRHIHIRRLIQSLVMIGSLYAIFGLCWFYISRNESVWLDTQPYKDSLVATFINRNTFAMYIGLNLNLCLTLLLATDPRRTFKSSLKNRIHYNLTKKLPQSLIQMAAYLFLYTALFLTASRAGVFFVLIGHFTFFALLMMKKGKNIVASLASITALSTIMLYVVKNYSVILDARSVKIDENFYVRIQLYQEIWSAIMRNPISGYGLGAFEQVFRYQKSITFDPEGIWLRAHNAYLEAMLGLGIPAAILLFLSCAIPFFSLLKTIKSNNNSTSTLSIIAATITVVLHSIFDFGIQSAANALTLFAILGAAMGRAINLPHHHKS